MKVEDIVNLVNKFKPEDFGVKNWLNQPAYFEKVLSNIDLEKSKDNLFIELGVFSGLTLDLINRNTGNLKVYGFDTFTGLPEDWASSNGNILYEKDYFSTPVPSDTDKNKFIVGKIEDTLLNFLSEKKQKIKFIHLDLDLYSSSKYAFNIIFDYLDDEAIIVVDDIYNFSSWDEHSIKSLSECFNDSKYELVPIATCGWHDGWASAAFKVLRKNSISVTSANIDKKFTLVTGLWDLKRGELEGWAKRDFQHYKDRFFELLQADYPMCVWISEDLKQDVLRIRKDKPTRIFIKNLEDFKIWNPFFDQIQNIRKDPNWFNIAGWLPESPQAGLEYYNPMMFTKMFMLNDSSIINPFNTEYFFWIDGGLTNTVPTGYFTEEDVLSNLPNYIKVNDKKFLFISYPYDANNEIHGFERTAMAKYCATDFVNYVCRGGFFGGNRDKISAINDLYYSVMKTTLEDGYMGADECLFTILAHRHNDLITRFEISGNGLVWPFFEELRNYSNENINNIEDFLDTDNVALYVLTFNSPKQFETLLKSMESYDKDFIDKPKKYLLDNSTDPKTFAKYAELCKKYNFEHIKKDNLGICGGRQWIAEHAEEHSFDFYFFFEDDMFFYNGKETTCQNGFKRHLKNLYKNSLEIAKDYEFDFIKFNYTEFFGDNGTQWAWYNVPQAVREQFFPNKTKLPVQGRDPDAPRTLFKNIRSYKSIPFVDGDIYYSNWPQVVTKTGNRKMFLTEKWAYPYEQTWMSYIFQQTKQNKIKPGLLLATPTEHNRFEHYDGKLRKES